MADSLWHEVTEEEKEEIRFEAKNLMNKFADKLGAIKTSGKHFENDSGFREEGSSWDTPEDFRDLTFANAPFVEDEFLVAEKGAWKK